MEKHPYFDLWLHSTSELSDLLSEPIVGRTVLHEWPLSCVQRLEFASGKQLIYKTQLRATTIEPEFFSAFHSALSNQVLSTQVQLPATRSLGNLRNSVTLVQEYIPAPRLEELELDDAALIEHGNCLLAEIQRFPPDLPVYTDISNLEKWSAVVQDTLTMLASLIEGGSFHLNTLATCNRLRRWAQSQSILATIQSPPVLVHHDLGGDNIFILPKGYQVIDWQRPVRGPAELDRAGYLTALEIDPLKYVNESILGLFWFLRLRWLVECKAHWFPPGETYDQQVADLADQILQL